VEPDKRLIQLISEENRKAQIDLYKMCFNILMRVAIRYKNNEEESVELVNDAFLRIVENLGKRKKNVPFEAWIKRIILNLAIDDYRKNKKKNEVIVNDKGEQDVENVSLNGIEDMIEDECLHRMLMSLPKATRNVFNLFAIDGYSHKEIAKMLDIAVETSKWHVKQARKNLKKQLILEQTI